MSVTAIIQARMGSERLPGKVLLDICGETMLRRVQSRVEKASRVDRVVIATSPSETDAVLVEYCHRNSMAVATGGKNEDDVLGRYRDVAALVGATTIVRITADCPLADPGLIDGCVAAFQASPCEYFSNVQPPTYPDGLDVEVFSKDLLDRAAVATTMSSDREHVTPWMQREAKQQRHATHEPSLAQLRFCVDDSQDLEFMRAIYAALPNKFFWRDVVSLLERRLDIATLMSTAKRNEGYIKSLKKEAKDGKSTADSGNVL